MKEILENIQMLDETRMEEVSGGNCFGSITYQLYYRGNKLPMDNMVSQICNMYPEAREIFLRIGRPYAPYANMTLNQLCESYGERKIQRLIYENS